MMNKEKGTTNSWMEYKGNINASRTINCWFLMEENPTNKRRKFKTHFLLDSKFKYDN